MDLGADGFQTFRHVVLPNIATALLAGGMLAFALSFDEVIVTTFTAGQQTTLPIWMLSELVRPRQRPVTNVVAVIVIAVTFLPILAAYYLTRERRGGRRRRKMRFPRRQIAMQTEMLIGSRFVKGTEHEEKILNPKTGETILSLPEASPSRSTTPSPPPTRPSPNGRARRRRARRLSPQARRPHRGRGRRVRRRSRRSTAASRSTPCSATRCRPSSTCFRFFAGACRVMPGSAAGEYLPGYTSMIRRDPIGVVASIAPWNYPLMMAAWKIAPALAAGNTVVLKPSEQTPLTTLKLARIAAEILPEGVLNVVVGRGETRRQRAHQPSRRSR